jgi:cell division protease FtsH
VAYRRAQHLIVGHREMLDELARTLLEHEVIERGDIERIVGGKRVAPLPPEAEPGPARLAAAEGRDARAEPRA